MLCVSLCLSGTDGAEGDKKRSLSRQRAQHRKQCTVAPRCYCFLIFRALVSDNPEKRLREFALNTNQTAPGVYGGCAENNSRKLKAEEAQLGRGMASRQGGSFNSILGRTKSPLACLYPANNTKQLSRRKNTE